MFLKCPASPEITCLERSTKLDYILQRDHWNGFVFMNSDRLYFLKHHRILWTCPWNLKWVLKSFEHHRVIFHKNKCQNYHRLLVVSYSPVFFGTPCSWKYISHSGYEEIKLRDISQLVEFPLHLQFSRKLQVKFLEVVSEPVEESSLNAENPHRMPAGEVVLSLRQG